MSPDTLFALANAVALVGWLALVLVPVAPPGAARLAEGVAGTAIPLLLAVAYTGIVLAFWSRAEGGFGSLAAVMALFRDPWIAVAGWLHYLAFDLFVGARVARTARREGIAVALVVPCLVLTFLFGPAGLLACATLRAGRSLRLATR
jgi:hypothetical protein